MRTPRVAKELVFGIVASALLGAPLATLGAIATVDEHPTTVTVPVGRIGDAVAYTWWYRQADQELRPLGASPEAFAVRSMNHSMDEGFRLRPTLVLGWSTSSDQGHYSGLSGAREFVDLVSRNVIRHDVPHSAVQGRMDADYGPEFDWGYGSAASGLRYQGRTFSLGQQLGEPQVQALRYDWGSNYHVQEAQSWVATRAQIDGQTALELRTQGRVAYPSANDDALRFTSSVWVSAESAYPLVTRETFVHENGTLAEELVRVLVDIRPGHEPIPWKTTDDSDRTDLIIERSGPSSRYPADGKDLDLCYPLSRAMRDASLQPGLVAWLALHPGAFLVGAKGGCFESGAGTWQLTFADPSGDAFAISFVQAAGAGAGFADANYDGPWKMRPFDPAKIPTNPTTLAHAQQALKTWTRGVVGPHAEPGGYFIKWGVFACCLLSFGTVVSYERELKHARITDTRHLYIGGGGDAGPLVIDVESGRLVWSVESGPSPEWPRIPPFTILKTIPTIGGDGSHPGGQESRMGSGFSVPTIKEIALATTSLLAIFLAVYFYPAIKSAAANLQLLLPGYAKVRRHELLNNAHREAILHAVQQDPGISPPELQRILGCGWSTVIYHVRTLERNGMISSLIDGRHKRIFPTGNIDWSARDRVAVLRNPKTSLVLNMIVREPGVAQKELTQKLRVRQSSIRWHLERLQRARLITHDRVGRQVRYQASSPSADKEQVPA